MNYDSSISVARMVAMCFIVACHVLQHFSNPLAFWFNTGVQMFFVMSGYLYGGRTIKNPLGFIGKNWCKILVPCWGVLLGALIGFICLGVELPKGMKLVRTLLLSDTMPGCEHLWFVSNILFCYMMIPLFDSFKRSLKTMSKCYFLVCISLIVSIIIIIGFAYRPFLQAGGFVCFVVGYYVAAFRENYGGEKLKTNANALEYFLIFMGTCAFLLRIMFELHPWPGLYGKLYLSMFPYIKSAIGIALFLAIKNYISCPANIVLKFSDRYSYSIYLVHHIFILGPLSIIGSFKMNIIATRLILCSAVLLKEVSNLICTICVKRFKEVA